jgi:aminopeptidase N
LLFKNDQIMSDVFFPIMHLDSVGSSHSISVDVNNPDEINEIFDGITYGKVDIIKKYFNRV